MKPVVLRYLQAELDLIELLSQSVRVKPLVSGQLDFLALLSGGCPGLGFPRDSSPIRNKIIHGK